MVENNALNEIKIKSNNLINLLECSICCCILSNCIITQCGHSFCTKCITNWINLHSTCPTCKSHLELKELVKDYLVDILANAIQKERSKEEYMSIEQNQMIDDINNKKQILSNIQSIFFNGLKEIFNSYNQFFAQTDKEYKEHANLIQMKINAIKERNSEMEALIKEKEIIETNNAKVQKDIEQSLLDYLQKLPQNPLLLSITTKVYIERKKIYIENLLLQPFDSCDKIYTFIENYFHNKYDDLIDWGNSNIYVYRQMPNGDKIASDNPIIKEDKVISLKLIPGDEIILIGNFILKSEEKKPCITYKFEQNYKGQSVNYFSCETCKLNWVCSNCIISCHTNHQVKMFKTNHIATWACCYCYKSKCNLQNNKNTPE